MTDPLDDRLKDAFQQLAGKPGEVDVSVEQLQALAEDRITGDERTRLLLVVSADAGLLKEYELLRQVAATRPKPVRTRPLLLQLAAVLAIAVSVTLLGRSLFGPKQEPLRGTDAVAQLSPAVGAEAGPGTSLVWRPVAGAVSYTVEFLAPDGRVAWTAATRDTSYAIPNPLPAGLGGAVRWWIAAELSDRTISRSPTRLLTIRP